MTNSEELSRYRYLRAFPQEDITMVRLLEKRVAETPGEVFYTWTGARPVTFTDFNARVNRMARNLSDVGVCRGTHVLVLMDASPDYLALWFAIAKAGAVEVPVNTAYHGDVLLHQISLSGAEVAVVDARYAVMLQAVADRAPKLRAVVVRPGAEADFDIPVHPFEILDLPADESNPGIEIPYDSTSCIIFTSGTTGPSKGVVLSHHYLAAYGLMYAETNRLDDRDVVMNFMPFFHIGAKFLTLAALAVRGRMHLQPRLSVSTFWDEVRANSITNFIAVGGICGMLLAQPERPDDADTTLRVVYAIPDPASFHDEFERRFACRISSAFGSTEIGFPIMKFPEDPYVPGTSGRPSAYYHVQIVDEFDNPVPPGTVGEIVVRPKHPYLVASGYIGMADKTVEAWRNLWMHSGDRGRMDADGLLSFEDRVSDSIRRRGENISSYEVEQLVARHAAVAEAIAVAVTSEDSEDEVRILVTLRQNASLTFLKLLEHCSDTMPYFMIPRYFDIVTDFPRTPTAKVEKYKIRANGLGPDTWDRERDGWVLRQRQLVHIDRQVGAAPRHERVR
jgi:crotonobetaine/carnitine-CoA ligase